MKGTDMARILNFASSIDPKTIEQAQQIASMPFIHPHVALMPDAHAGIGSAVGTVIPTVRAVMPAAVGVDIGCGMIAARLDVTLAELEQRFEDGHTLHDLRMAIEKVIPVSVGQYTKDLNSYTVAPKIAELERLAEATGVDLSHSPKWRNQLGTLGSGNHFIELCLDTDNVVWLFLHSGSRGVGNKIAKRHIQIAQEWCADHGVTLPHKDLAYLEEGTPEFDQYIQDLQWAQRFAYLNRAEMMDRYFECFQTWMDGIVGEVERINCHHNYTVPTVIDGQDVWLTRKGAISAHEGDRGVIPGSMGTRSYVVVGKGNHGGLYSAPHGAGRNFSRTEARKRFDRSDLEKAMAGIEYNDEKADKLIDEIPGAYKDIDQVMVDAEDLVTITAELRQIMNIKGD